MAMTMGCGNGGVAMAVRQWQSGDGGAAVEVGR